MEETGCKILCGAPTTLTVKGLMMMMMMMMKALNSYIFEIVHFERVYPSPKSCIHHQNPVTKLTGDGDG